MDSTVLLVEDDPMTTELIRTYLQQEHFRVLTADNGRAALDLARQMRPDLIVLDLMLPRVDGWDVCRILRTETQVPIIMLTARTTEDDVLLGIDLGADDYIKKPFSPRELVARVRMVMRRLPHNRGAGEQDGIIQHGPLRIDFTRHEVCIDEQRVHLTASEFYLLGLLAQHPGQVFTRASLLERTPGVDNNSMERTIDFHIMNLRRKIERNASQPHYIQTVHGVGYKFAGDPP